jgi:hypothetical protein
VEVTTIASAKPRDSAPVALTIYERSTSEKMKARKVAVPGLKRYKTR